MQKRALVGIAVVALAAILGSPSAMAAWSTPETVAALPSEGGTDGVVLATDAVGGAALAWGQAVSIRSDRTVARIATRAAAGGWAPPVTLSRPGENSGIPSVAMAPSGETTVTWVQERVRRGRKLIQVVAKSRSPRGAWGSSVVLARSEEGVARAPSAEAGPEITIGTSGRPVVAFCLGARGDQEHLELDKQSGDGRWGRPTDVAHTTYCTSTAVAVDGQGETLVAWCHGLPQIGLGIVRVQSAIVASRGGLESRSQTLSPSGRVASSLALETNVHGEAVLEWTLNGRSGGPLEAVVRRPGGPFRRSGGNRPVAARVLSSGVSVDSSGAAAILFNGSGVEVSSTPTIGGSWSPPMVLSNGPAEEVLLGGNDSGALTAVWTALKSPTGVEPVENRQRVRSIEAATRPAGGSWSQTTTISPYRSQDPAVSVDPDGTALVAWENETSHRLEASQFNP